MSDFARGVVGVFVVGMVAGAGALMFIPKSSPSATQSRESSGAGLRPNIRRGKATRRAQNQQPSIGKAARPMLPRSAF